MTRRAPAGLGARGRRFWGTVTADFELGPDEVELLVEVARQLDLVEALAADPEANPRTVLAARGLAARLLGQLSLPEGVASPGTVKARAAAGARWAGEAMGDETSRAATRAARARWHGPQT